MSLLTVPQLKASVYDPSSPGIAVMANECSDFYERFDIMNVNLAFGRTNHEYKGREFSFFWRSFS